MLYSRDYQIIKQMVMRNVYVDIFIDCHEDRNVFPVYIHNNIYQIYRF